MRPWAIGIALPLSACANPSSPTTQIAEARATPLCVVLKDPQAYVGKHLFVEAYQLPKADGTGWLFDEHCYPSLVGLRELPENATTRQLKAQLNHYASRSVQPVRVPVVYSGVFTEESSTKPCAGLCPQFSLATAEIVAVGRY